MTDRRYDIFQGVSAEHAPMDSLDELPVHQWSEREMRFQSTTDPRAYERYWFTCQDRTGDLFIVTGFGLYPNLGTVEAYAIVNLRGQHTTVRAHRRLDRNRALMRVGPISFEPVRPFQEWRLTLDDNDYGISFDFRWYDTKRAVLQPVAGLGGYETFGRQEGTVLVRGQRLELTRETHQGSRDHHWGVRDGVGGPGHSLNPKGTSVLIGGQWVEFRDWSIWANRILYNLGDKRPGTGRIIRQERKLTFDAETCLFTGGVVRNTLEGGEVKELHFRRLGNQVAFLRCGMYGGREGGTPNGNIWHGMYAGDNVVSGETFDVSQPEVQRQLAGPADHHCEVTCDGEVTYGIFESHDPMTWELARDRRGGFSILE
jgi:hypothetical protein